MAATVNTFVDALLNEDEAAATKIIEDLVKYNQDAIKANEQYKVILPDGFKQAVKLEIRSRKLGVGSIDINTQVDHPPSTSSSRQ